MLPSHQHSSSIMAASTRAARTSSRKQIYCHHCQEDSTATTIDVCQPIYEVPIEEFLSQRRELEEEYREGLEVMKRRNAYS